MENWTNGIEVVFSNMVEENIPTIKEELNLKIETAYHFLGETDVQ